MTQLAKFDYAALSPESRIVVQQKAGEIHERVDAIRRSTVEIGQRLIEVKALLDHGYWGAWLENEFAWSQDTAQNFMNVARMAAENPNYSVFEPQFDRTALTALSSRSTPAKAQQEAVELAGAGNQITAKKAVVIISEHKAAKVHFTVGQRVYYQGKLLQIALINGDHSTLRSLVNNQKLYNIPLADLQTMDDHAATAQHPPAQPAGTPVPSNATLIHYRDLIQVYEGVFGVVTRIVTQGNVYLTLEAAFIRGTGKGITRRLLDASLVKVIQHEAVSEKTLHSETELLAYLLEVTTAVAPVSSSPDPAPAAPPKPVFHDGETVQTRTGHIGAVVGEPGRFVTVQTEHGTRDHFPETLTKVDPPPAAEPAKPAPATKRDWEEDDGGKVGTATSRSGRMRAKLEALGLAVYHVTARNDGTYRIEFDGGVKYSVDEAIARARAIGTELLDLGYAVREMTYWNGGTPLVVLEHGETDSDEWYTPADIIEAVRAFLGGIDVDPASCAAAQATVQASTYYDRKSDGLSADWKGRVWLNPPYSMPGVEKFTSRLIAEYDAGYVSEAVVLVNNRTDADWCQSLLRRAAVVCFSAERISFIHPRRESPGNRQGQIFFYFGKRRVEFAEAFASRGVIMNCWANAPHSHGHEKEAASEESVP